MKIKAICVLVLLAGTLTGWSVGAQGGLTLKGVVQDQTGSLVPSAKLILTNTETAEEISAQADESGGFAFHNLKPGKYSLKITAEGFEDATQPVIVADLPMEELIIKLGIKLTEEVIIADSASEQVTAPENNADAIDFSADFLKTLPAQTEDILPIIGNFLSTSAQGTEGLTVLVDGVEGTQINLPTDAIRRVIINRNPYSSSFRRPGDGRVEITTRDGSRRRYDGTFAYYIRNSRFDARDTFTRRQGLDIANLDRRLFSASFGGPVPGWKKATFFVSGNNLIHNEDVLSSSIATTGNLLIQHAPTAQDRIKLISRLDYRPSEDLTLSARYYFYRNAEENAGLGAPFVLPEQGFPVRESGHRLLFGAKSILSPTFLNELTVSIGRENVREGEKPSTHKIVTRGTFIGGPSQVDLNSQETQFEVQDALTYNSGNHKIRFGGGFRTRRLNSVDATNFVGTYFFQGLFEYLDSRPVEFRVFQGDPADSIKQHEAYGFFEDEIRLRRWLTVTPGVRYDWQSSIQDFNNFGGRLSFALAPGSQKMVIRGGAGIFYERLQSSVIKQLFVDGVRTRELRILNPSFPDPFRNAANRPLPLPSIWQLAPNLSAPYLFMASVSFERELWRRTHVSVEYQRLRGVHLLRTRNINAPLDPAIFGFQFTGLRVNPNFRDIFQVESSASSRSSALKVTFKGRLGRWFKGMAQYTYSSATDDTSGPLVLPENNWNLVPELGRSSFDLRHRFSYAGTFELPFNFRFGSVISLASGRPFDITTGFDDNGDQNAYDRPPGGTRNTALGPPIAQLDVRLTKLFRLPTLFKHKPGKAERKTMNFEVSFDAFNALNHPNTPVIVGELGSQIFGQASTANISRTLQLSVKYSF
jgi:hypothetical protein